MLWRKYLVVAGLYLAQGLPGGLLAYTVPTLLREQQISLKLIAAVSLLALPWSLKILWSRFLDQTPQPHYYFIASLVCAASLWLLLSLQPLDYWLNEALASFFILLLLANFVMASQDVLTDGLVVRFLNEHERGLANSFQVIAYKMGMLVGGALFLANYELLAWQGGMLILIAALLLAYTPYLLFAWQLRPAPEVITAEQSQHDCQPHKAPAESALFTQSLFAIISSFVRQPGIKNWLLILLLYKLGDGLISTLVRPFWLDYGLAVKRIALMSSVSICIGIVAGLCAGYLWQWAKRKHVSNIQLLLYLAILQSLSIGCYWALSLISQQAHWLGAVIIFEHSVDVMATVILFASMMSYCRKATAGVDYTFQATLLLVSSGSLHLISGFIGDQFGYAVAFFTALICTLPVLYLLFATTQSNMRVEL